MIKKQDTTTLGMGFSITQQMLVHCILNRAGREESNQETRKENTRQTQTLTYALADSNCNR